MKQFLNFKKFERKLKKKNFYQLEKKCLFFTKLKLKKNIPIWKFEKMFILFLKTIRFEKSENIIIKKLLPKVFIEFFC